MKEAIFEAISILIVALAGWLGAGINKWVKDKEIKEEFINKNAYAQIAVDAVEQMAKHDTTISKFEEAKAMLVEMFKDNKLNAGEAEIKALIESAVKKMNDELKGNE